MSRSIHYHRPKLEALEDRILLSHKGGGGGGGGGTTAAQYELIDLGTLGGTVSMATDVNADGVVVGNSQGAGHDRAVVIVPEDTDGNGIPDGWFRDDNGDGANDLMIELTTVPDVQWSGAMAINASGQVVGWYRNAPDARAFLITPQMVDGKLQWNADTNNDGVNDYMTDLGTLGGSGSVAFDINNDGRVVGHARSTDGNEYPFLWNPDAANGTTGTMMNLGTLDSVNHYGSAYKINDNGQVVGVTNVQDSTSTYGSWLRGFIITPQDTDSDGNPDLWRSDDAAGINTLMTDLGVLDAHSSEAYAVNDAGVVVGEAGSTISEVQGHAVRWDQQAGGAYAVTDLGGLHKPQFYSAAQDINADGVIVGFSQEMATSLIMAGGTKVYATTGEERAFVIKNGDMQPLDQLVSSLAGLDTVNAALAISDNDYIVGWGKVNDNAHAFIAVPTAALMASSAGPGNGQTLTVSQLSPIVQEAIARWSETNVDVSILTTVDFRITDLPGTTLGLASGSTIYIDSNAAGWGWFVDPTPWDDSEFTTPGDQGEMNHMDLLSAVEHELGHVLGLQHEDGGVMSRVLAPGERLGLGSAEVWEQALYALAQVQSGKR